MSATSTAPPQSFVRNLTDSGLRSTPQREIIYDSLLQKRDHPTADEVYARAKSEMPSISLATVYNCLETFVQRNLVRAVNFERGPTRYLPQSSPPRPFSRRGSRFDSRYRSPRRVTRESEVHPSSGLWCFLHRNQLSRAFTQAPRQLSQYFYTHVQTGNQRPPHRHRRKRNR